MTARPAAAGVPVRQTVVLEPLDPALVRALSANSSTHNRWTVRHARTRAKGLFTLTAQAQGLPKPLIWPVSVTFNWIVPTRGRRDIDNLASNWIVKACLDSLVRGEWLPDDSSQHVTAVLTTMEYQKGRRALVIEIQEAAT